jgi:hypothetical protein
MNSGTLYIAVVYSFFIRHGYLHSSGVQPIVYYRVCCGYDLSHGIRKEMYTTNTILSIYLFLLV